jgi:hypothetical protein
VREDQMMNIGELSLLIFIVIASVVAFIYFIDFVTSYQVYGMNPFRNRYHRFLLNTMKFFKTETCNHSFKYSNNSKTCTKCSKVFK